MVSPNGEAPATAARKLRILPPLSSVPCSRFADKWRHGKDGQQGSASLSCASWSMSCLTEEGHLRPLLHIDVHGCRDPPCPKCAEIHRSFCDGLRELWSLVSQACNAIAPDRWLGSHAPRGGPKPTTEKKQPHKSSLNISKLDAFLSGKKAHAGRDGAKSALSEPCRELCCRIAGLAAWPVSSEPRLDLCDSVWHVPAPTMPQRQDSPNDAHDAGPHLPRAWGKLRKHVPKQSHVSQMLTHRKRVGTSLVKIQLDTALASWLGAEAASLGPRLSARLLVHELYPTPLSAKVDSAKEGSNV